MGHAGTREDLRTPDRGRAGHWRNPQSQRNRFQRCGCGDPLLVRHSGECRADAVAETDGDSVPKDAPVLETGCQPDFPGEAGGDRDEGRRLSNCRAK